MGGDLNLKKSWAPNLMRNQEKVRAAEKAALHGKKRIAQLRREREEERALEQLKKLQEATGGKPAVDPKLAWMYQTTSDDDALMNVWREAYLLGRKRVDMLLRAQLEDINNSPGGQIRFPPSSWHGNGKLWVKLNKSSVPHIRIMLHEKKTMRDAIVIVGNTIEIIASDTALRARSHDFPPAHLSTEQIVKTTTDIIVVIPDTTAVMPHPIEDESVVQDDN